MARNAPLAHWEVHDPYDRPLRLYRPTAGCPYFSATWYEPGVERQQRTTLGREEHPARRWCQDKADWLRRAHRRRRPERPLQPGQALVDEYLDPDNQPGWGSVLTEGKARNLTRAYVPERLRRLPCEHWRTDDLREIVLAAAHAGRSRSYLQDIRNMLSGLVRVGIELEYLDADQINMSAVRVPKRTHRSRRQPDTAPGRDDEDSPAFRVDRRQLPGPERIAAVVAALPEPMALMVDLTAHSGFRWGEVTALRAEDVNLDQRTIQVVRALAEDTNGRLSIQPPKNDRCRETFYPDHLAARLAAAVERARADAAAGGLGLLFPAPRGRYLRRSNTDTWWTPARRKAGWRPGWTFHTLRHCAAVWMIYDMRYDLNEVAAVLGHADKTITERIYVQAREGVAARMAAKATVRPPDDKILSLAQSQRTPA